MFFVVDLSGVRTVDDGYETHYSGQAKVGDQKVRAYGSDSNGDFWYDLSVAMLERGKELGMDLDALEGSLEDFELAVGCTYRVEETRSLVNGKVKVEIEEIGAAVVPPSRVEAEGMLRSMGLMVIRGKDGQLRTVVIDRSLLEGVFGDGRTT